ncbi:MAG TPA: nicotinamide-nucleotide amidohydrolase family protein [Sporichthyaceae bacterium]|nr:nicotinamide-nucleotide amidohydrolase family protein [Sporichthyaceae bacterium]
MTRVELITVGDELLSGLVLNSNVARVADALGGIGLGLSVVCDVSDDIPEIVAALRTSCARADVVLCSGGLGPTSDDLTRDALATLAGVEMDRDAGLEEIIRARYAEWNVTVPDLALRQADVPRGAVPVPNSRGSAPGLRLSLGQTTIYALPGVPRELEAMLAEHIVPELAAGLDGPRPVTATVRVALSGESSIATALDAVDLSAVRVAYLALPGDVAVRLTGPAGAVAAAADAVAQRLGAAAYSRDGAGLPAVVHGLLRERKASLAVAESLTGGLVAAALTDPAGASVSFRGGAIVYATEAKAELGVDPELLAERGPVDADVALGMARCVRERLGATHGVATTGVAGPDPVGDYEVGTVFVAVDSAEGSRVIRRSLPPSRELVRTLTVVHALDLLRRHLLGLEPYELTG